jgi:asparagine synthase (glutamine-hydrolysing)
VAEHCQTEHHLLVLRVGELRDHFFELIDQIIRHTDEPFGDSSALPTYWVSKLARQQVTVILGGDGADEVFGGYSLYQGLRFAQLYQRLPGVMRQGLIEPLMNRWVEWSQPGQARWRAEHWRKRITDSNLPLRQMLASKFAIAPQRVVDSLAPASARLLTPAETQGEAWVNLGEGAEPFTQTQYANTRFLQLNDFLVKVDRMSMAHSLEARHPFLDHKVVEFAATIPPQLKLRRFETKAILRAVAARHLPAATAQKRKHGFEVPIAHWFRTALHAGVEERLMSSAILREQLCLPMVQKVLAEHVEGRQDHAQLIWCLLALAAWHETYMEDYDAA